MKKAHLAGIALAFTITSCIPQGKQYQSSGNALPASDPNVSITLPDINLVEGGTEITHVISALFPDE